MTTSTLSIRLRTRTPLYTGGVDGKMDRIHETGILGSLRWWYEAIVRGLGGEACDPTEHDHELTGERLKQFQRLRNQGVGWWEALDQVGICDACKVFGTTGWKRRFRLEVHHMEGEIDLTEGMLPSGRVHPDRRRSYRVGGWMLRGGYFGTLELRFTGEERILLCEILPTLLFIERWGALGPKTSIGYGVIEITEIQIGDQTYERSQSDWRMQLSNLASQNCQGSYTGKWWWSQEAHISSSYHGILPALTNMFFGKVRFEVADSDWWRTFREIGWLQSGQIGKDEGTGQDQAPAGPFTIPNPLPISRIDHWVQCHDTFPIAPIVRTRLRYDSGTGICADSNGESNWCKFVFGTVRGNETICGYCGVKVRRDRNNQNRWWCNNGHVSLSNQEVFDGKRLQSKVRVSWAYRVGNNEWEFRLWGWMPEHAQNDTHRQQRDKFLSELKRYVSDSSELIQPLQMKDSYLIAKKEYKDTPTYLKALLMEDSNES